MKKLTISDRAGPENDIKEFFKRWPGFYSFMYDFFSPIYFGGLSPRSFLKKYPNTGLCLNLGSGTRRIDAQVLNVDIANYDGVDVVADITKLPYSDGGIARIICDQTLEHLHNPEQAIMEIRRVLAPGGYGYISTPFMYPFHASPSDYQRWTHVGLKHLLKDFEIIEIGVRSGPFSTFTVHLCYLFASLLSFGNERLYWLIVYSMGIPLFPVKCLDILGNKLPFAINMSSVPYVVIQKQK